MNGNRNWQLTVTTDPLVGKIILSCTVLGSLLCASLIVFIREIMKLPNDVKMIYWTDSMISLSWIRSPPTRWKSFVANRVSETKSLSRVNQCHGAKNPADLVTRGFHANDLVKSTLWLHGPKFLVKALWIISMLQGTWRHRCLSRKLMASTSRSYEPVFSAERWCSLTKAFMYLLGYSALCATWGRERKNDWLVIWPMMNSRQQSTGWSSVVKSSSMPLVCLLSDKAALIPSVVLLWSWRPLLLKMAFYEFKVSLSLENIQSSCQNCIWNCCWSYSSMSLWSMVACQRVFLFDCWTDTDD